MLGLSRELTPIQPEIVFSIGNFGIANSTLTILLIALGFLLLGIFVVSKFSLVPTSFQSFVEMIYESIVDLVQQITGNEKHAKKITPVIATILVYFALANIIAIIPGLTDITYNGIAIFRTPTSDFNTAFGVSLAAVVVLNIVSIQEWGIVGYLGKFFNVQAIVKGFKKSLMDGFIGIVEFFVGILDIIGEVAKVVSLSFRLFGNVYAGQVLAIIIMGAFAWGLPTIWSVMSNFTGILQGFVFAALVAVYYSLSLKPDEETDQG
jgi:F-type H+-transporting ATPase subunit a